MCKLAEVKRILCILFFILLGATGAMAQDQDTLKPKKDTSAYKYNKRLELIYDGKRYRRYNNYLTIGGGPNYSSIRRIDQKNVGVDFQFHVQKQYFQIGAYMSGDDFGNNKCTEFHLGIGLRHERNKFNLAAFIGPSYSIFVTEEKDSTGAVVNLPIHNAIGGYVSLQAVYKIKYDVGIGGEIFADYTPLQTMVGCKVIIFFSGAYRGVKRGFKSKTTTNKKK